MTVRGEWLRRMLAASLGGALNSTIEERQVATGGIKQLRPFRAPFFESVPQHCLIEDLLANLGIIQIGLLVSAAPATGDEQGGDEKEDCFH
jgi:hypothetical protein